MTSPASARDQRANDNWSAAAWPNRYQRSRLLALFVALLAAAQFSLGGYALSCCMSIGNVPNCLVSAGVVLTLVALVQYRIARDMLHAQTARAGATSQPIWQSNEYPLARARAALRWFFVGGCLSYGVALAIGPRPGVEFAFAASLGIWLSIVLLPLTATPQTLERWRKLIEQRTPRRVAVAVYHTLLLLTLSEAALRGCHSVQTLQPLSAAAASESRTPSGQALAETALRPGMLRVAVVDGLTLTAGRDVAGHGTVCVDRVESLMAGFQVRRIHRGLNGDGRPTSAWREELQAFDPDLVLGVVAIEQGLSPTAEASDIFDWRSLATVDLVRMLIARPASSVVLPAADQSPATGNCPTDPAGRLGEGAAGRLSICRTPLDEPTKLRWHETFAHLDAFAGECAALEMPLALVVVPDGFQVNRVLCEVLRRRAGYQIADLDLALPQRRLAAYAVERQLALLDLLPYLRASRNPVYRSGEGGWNGEGQAVAGQAISGWLRAQYSGLIATAQLSGGG
jgi:hypothetical protein